MVHALPVPRSSAARSPRSPATSPAQYLARPAPSQGWLVLTPATHPERTPKGRGPRGVAGFGARYRLPPQTFGAMLQIEPPYLLSPQTLIGAGGSVGQNRPPL